MGRLLGMVLGMHLKEDRKARGAALANIFGKRFQQTMSDEDVPLSLLVNAPPSYEDLFQPCSPASPRPQVRSARDQIFLEMQRPRAEEIFIKSNNDLIFYGIYNHNKSIQFQDALGTVCCVSEPISDRRFRLKFGSHNVQLQLVDEKGLTFGFVGVDNCKYVWERSLWHDDMILVAVDTREVVA